MKVFVLGFLICLVSSIPTNFDLRVQTERIQYTTTDLQPEGICAGYAWAKEIAQIAGNAAGLYQSEKMTLSAQQILDCTQTQSQICYKATLEAIRSAIKRVSIEGLTTESCYPNRPFAYPNPFCKRQCHDGSKFPFNYYLKFNKYTNFSDIVNLFKTKQSIAVLAIIKVDQAYNYYSAFNPVLTHGGPSSFFQYRVAEVLGWKNAQSSTKVILRAGPGEQWGYNGFIDLELSNYGKYIEEFYSVELSDQSNLQTE